MANSTTCSFKTGIAPGIPKHTGQTWVLGLPPNSVEQEQKALDLMVKKDKQRQSYYNYYSSKKWGRADTYDLCINTSAVGYEGAVELILEALEKKNAFKA